MIQLTIDDNLKTTLIIGNQHIFCERIIIDVEPERTPDVTVDGVYAIQTIKECE